MLLGDKKTGYSLLSLRGHTEGTVAMGLISQFGRTPVGQEKPQTLQMLLSMVL